MTNRRMILWLLAGILVFAFANFMLARNVSHKAAVIQKSSLLSVPDEAVSGIVVMRGDAVETRLARTGEWRIVDPFSGSADESVVLRLLDALEYTPVSDAYSDKELFKLGERTRADFDLAPPRLTLCVKSGERERRIGFGAFTPSKAEVYACVEGLPAVFVVPSNMLAAVDVPTESFRRRTLFSSGEESVAAFDVKRGSEFLRFRKDGDVWTMVQPTEVTASAEKIKKLLADVCAARAVDFLWPVGSSNEVSDASVALLSGYGLDPENAVTVTLKGVDGTERRISFGSEANDGLVYALVHNGTAIVTVDRSLKEQASLGNADFADTRIFPFEPAQVAGLSISDGGVSCLLAKQEDGSWRMDSPVSAEADAAAVESLLSSVLALRGADEDEDGVEIGVAPDARKAKVSRRSLGVAFRLEDLRSLDIQKIDPATVRRLSVTGTDTNSTTSVVYDRDRRAWNVESSPRKGTVDEKAVERVLKAVYPLRAERVVKLKVTAGDLSAYGLDNPWLTVAIDLSREDSTRRNILVGDRTNGGRFATVGASDAGFVLPDAACADLSQEIVAE